MILRRSQTPPLRAGIRATLVFRPWVPRRLIARTGSIFKRILFVLASLAIWSQAYSQEITILYSGDTHAMLYPCNCPAEPDGGISRRASLIKQIRQENPNTIVVDAGGFFAGGLKDDYTQNVQLDMSRSLINLKAMELMQYDAVGLADDEFNFGRNFLEEYIAQTKLNFLSANIRLNKVSAYIIKEISGVKIAIIGLTNLSAKIKAGGVEFLDLKAEVKKSIEEARAKGAKLVLLLSHLGESQDLKLIRDIPGIDIVVAAGSRKDEGPSVKVGSTLLVRVSWQGRRIGKLSLTLDNDKIIRYKAEDLRLSDKIENDPQVLAILPECFADSNCKKEGLFGSCNTPGSKEARCIFTQPQKVNLTVITPKECNVCDTEAVVKQLKYYFPGLVASYLYYPDAKSEKMIKQQGLRFLPAYLFGPEAEKEKSFDNFKENLVKQGDFYLVRPQFCGMSYLLGRKKIKGKLDLVLSLYDKYAAAILDAVKEFKPAIHFLAIEKEGKFEVKSGRQELEAYLRAVCVQKYYPKAFFDYISCQSKNIDSSWWEDCLGDLDISKVKACSRSPEGADLLRVNVGLNKELDIMAGPTYLMDNQEIFSILGSPSKEEFKKLFKQ